MTMQTAINCAIKTLLDNNICKMPLSNETIEKIIKNQGFEIIAYNIPLDENDEEILEILRDKKAIILLNKSDLTPVVTKEMLEARTDMPVLAISARQEQGVELLEEQIKSMFFAGELSFNDEVYITNVRHKTALEEAYQSLTMVENSIAMEMPEDFFSIDLMNAYEALGRIVGESVGEDLVNEIFSKFCTGK